MPVLDRLIVFISTVLTSSSLIEPLVLARHGSYRTGTSPTLWADAADTQVFFRIIFEILPQASLFGAIPRKSRSVYGGGPVGLDARLGPPATPRRAGGVGRWAELSWSRGPVLRLARRRGSARRRPPAWSGRCRAAGRAVAAAWAGPRRSRPGWRSEERRVGEG